MQPTSPRLGALTGLRFGAAVGILLFHYGGPLVAGAPGWLGRLQRGGYAWVGLFYVLSGFVLAHANPEPMGPAERRAFLSARLARLYPAYLVAFALAAPFAVQRWWDGGPAAAVKMAVVATATLLLVHAWAPPLARLWNAPGWSTSVIASFYAAFPPLAARLGRLRRRGLLAALAGAWALSLAFPLAYLALAPDGPGAADLAHEPPWLLALKFHPVPRAGEFVAGVALGLLHRRGLALPRAGGAAAIAALAVAVAVIASGRAPYVLLHNGLLVPLYAVALLGLARGDGLAGRALASAPARVLGDAAFALYALQEPLWRWARLVGGDRAPASPAFVAGFCVAATGIAVAVSLAVERPARRWLRARLAAGPRRAVEAVAGGARRGSAP
ncbi:acyltransferase family protein [Anaeromyxobacter oryzisoli]|uniref:acyltransferase family protein n=1 Tax=Anaeromyxobacter oryzisoli TaxID=2925408 RepID=UPI001F586296|nr:acyltransferase [Anaeromyxobacter sp. SG63]